VTGERVLFVGDGSRWSVLAAEHLRCAFDHVDSVFWDHGDPPANAVPAWSGDHVFCFKADLVLPAALLDRVTGYAVNFHPSVPRFRGVGGYHYALADGDGEFGVTVHHMVPKIDAGGIIEVRRFPILPTETAEALTERTAAHLLVLFYDMIHLIRGGAALPVSAETWGTALYTRKMLARFLSERTKTVRA